MADLVHGADTDVMRWVAERIEHIDAAEALPFGPFRAIGVVVDRALVAGCVYHNFVPRYGTCEISFAAESPRWATRGTIRALLSVPFLQWGCHRVQMVTSLANERAIRLIRGIGFTREGTHAHAFGPGKHAVSFRLLRRDFDRLFMRRHQHGQERGQSASAA